MGFLSGFSKVGYAENYDVSLRLLGRFLDQEHRLRVKENSLNNIFGSHNSCQYHFILVWYMGPLYLSRHDVQLIDRPAFLSFFRYTPSACPIRTPILVLWGSRSPQIPRKRSPSPPPREFFGFRHPGLSRDGTTSGGPSPSSPSGGPSPPIRNTANI